MEIRIILFSAAFLNTLVITFIILTIGIVLINSNGMEMSFKNVVLSYLALILGSLSGCAFMYMIVSMFKKNSAVGAFTGIVCAASGFLIGAYMPISMFADWLQVVANTLPASHIAGIFRNLLMGSALDNMNSLIQSEQFVNSMKEGFSLELNFFGQVIQSNIMWLYASLSLVGLIGLDIVVFAKTNKRK